MAETLLGVLRKLEAQPGGTLQAAMAYASAGLPVFPCAPGGKQPLTERGFLDASCDPVKILAWFGWEQGVNIGIATGRGIDVLDIDVHPGGDGYGTLAQLQEVGLVAGALQAVQTPSGGVHLYFPSDPARPQRSWSRGTAHVDFRGDGGYVIAPPSTLLIDGQQRVYRPIAFGTQVRLIDADAIRALLTPRNPVPRPRQLSGTAPKAGRRLAEWLAASAEGTRNGRLFWASCRLAGLGMDEPEIGYALEAAARHAGLPDTEIAQTIHSAWRTVQLNPGEPPASPAPGPDPGRGTVTR